MSPQEITQRYWDQVPQARRLGDLVNLILGLEVAPNVEAIDPEKDPANAFIRDRIFACARLIQQKLSEIDPVMVSENGLQHLTGALQNVFNELDAFRANGNLGHLANARSHLDSNVAQAMWGFFPQSDGHRADTAHIEAIRRISAQASERIDDLTRKANKAQTELAAQADAVEEDLRAAVEGVAALDIKITQRVQENDAVIAKLQKDFAEAERERLERFNSALDLQKTEYAEQTKIKDSEAISLLSRLQEQEQRVLVLVEAIGNRGITANYSVIAEEEIAAADRWRYATVGIFSTGMIVALIIFGLFIFQGGGNLDLKVIALRLGFAIAITAPALYTARESARHRTTGDRARQAEMELASLGPFIANLERDTQDSIRRGLVSRYFGQRYEAHSVEPPVRFKEVGEFAVELVKAAGARAPSKKGEG